MTKNRKFLALAAQIVAVLAILVTLSLCFVGCNGDVDPDAPPVDFNRDDLGRVPEEASIQGVTAIDGAQVTATSAELSTDEAVKATAAYLFNLANANLEKVEYYANYAVGGGTANVTNFNMAGDMKVREVRIKDGAAMYMVTLGRVTNGYLTGNSSKPVSFIIGICRGILDYGNRKYTPDGKTMYVQEGDSGCLDETSVANFFTDKPYINWDKCGKVKSESIEDFMKNEYYRNHYFETNSSLINAKNLVSASVVRDDELDCYNIEMTVDVNSDALELATESTRESAGSDDIVFAYQTIKCQVWDCGLFRTYETADSWEGSMGPGGMLKGSTSNEWTKYFTYNKENAPGLQIPTDMTWYK